MQTHLIVAFVQFYVRCRDAAQALSLAPAAKLTVEGWKGSVIQVSFVNKAINKVINCDGSGSGSLHVNGIY